MVPTLSSIVHVAHRGDTAAAMAALLRTDWSHLRCFEQPDAHTDVGQPSEMPAAAPFTADLTARPRYCDRDWAYLFRGDELHVYLFGALPNHRKELLPWASWPVAQLPSVTAADLRSVQTRGEFRRQDTQFWAGVEDRIREITTTGRES
jgi:hypothetical protein